MRRLVRLLFISLLSLSASGCLPWFYSFYPFDGAFGTTSEGMLKDGETLPREGPHHRLYHASSKAWGVPTLPRALLRTADLVAEEYPGAVLYIGDMSGERGGHIPGHSSHRAGRDVDLAFFTDDLWGRPVTPYPLTHFDRYGVGRAGANVRLFNTAENWAIVEALLTDPEISVQWIFVSNGLKARLLEWALANNRSIEIIGRAAAALKQPGDSAPHDDHFHVRIHCPNDGTGHLCKEVPPIRPWAHLSPKPNRPTDEELLELALEGL